MEEGGGASCSGNAETLGKEGRALQSQSCTLSFPKALLITPPSPPPSYPFNTYINAYVCSFHIYIYIYIYIFFSQSFAIEAP